MSSIFWHIKNNKNINKCIILINKILWVYEENSTKKVNYKFGLQHRRLYSWNLKTWGESDLPQYNALFGVSFMMGLNLGIIAGFLDMFGLNIFTKNTPKKEIILFAFILLAINYFWLVHNGKYRQIAKEYKNEPKEKRFQRALLLWLYVVMSFVIISFVAILSGKLKGLH